MVDQSDSLRVGTGLCGWAGATSSFLVEHAKSVRIRLAAAMTTVTSE
jgi:hypothetical protein